MIGRNTPDGQICWICSLDSHVQTLYNLADYRALLSSLASRASTSSFDKRSTIGSYTSHSLLFLTTLVLLPYNLTKSTPAPPALLAEKCSNPLRPFLCILLSLADATL
nr:hypothetical protein Iba_chr04bCG8240 [Ipomoea batatas]